MANPFKEAEKRRKKSPGGENEPRTGADETTPVVTPEPESSEAAQPAVEVTVPETKTEPAPPAVPEEQEEPVPVVVTDIKTFYQKAFVNTANQELVNVRKQFTITPSLDKKLKKAVKNREVRSANHLVNTLLELYFAGKLTLEEENK